MKSTIRILVLSIAVISAGWVWLSRHKRRRNSTPGLGRRNEVATDELGGTSLEPETEDDRLRPPARIPSPTPVAEVLTQAQRVPVLPDANVPLPAEQAGSIDNCQSRDAVDGHGRSGTAYLGAEKPAPTVDQAQVADCQEPPFREEVKTVGSLRCPDEMPATAPAADGAKTSGIESGVSVRVQSRIPGGRGSHTATIR